MRAYVDQVTNISIGCSFVQVNFGNTILIKVPGFTHNEHAEFIIEPAFFLRNAISYPRTSVIHSGIVFTLVLAVKNV